MEPIKYKVTYRQDKEITKELDPEDFKDCWTIQQLKSHVMGKFRPCDVRYSDIMIEDIMLPDELLTKWKAIVGFIPDNVMTYKAYHRIMSRQDEMYVREYTGEYLNHCRFDTSGFSLGNYRDFCFKEKTRYKCWLRDTDHWDYVATCLVFAKPIN